MTIASTLGNALQMPKNATAFGQLYVISFKSNEILKYCRGEQNKLRIKLGVNQSKKPVFGL